MKQIRSYRANNTNGLDEERIREKEVPYQHTVLSDEGLPLEETTFLPDGSAEHVYKYEYDASGNLIDEQLLEEDGEVAEHRSMEYDQHNRLVKEFIHYLDDTADVVTYEYDEAGRLISRRSTDSDGEEGNRLVNEYQDGRLVSETEYDAGGEILTRRLISYDEQGHISEDSITSPENTYRHVYDYSDSGLPVMRRQYDANGHLVERHTYVHDEKGLLSEITGESASGIEITSNTYDEAGNVIRQEEKKQDGTLLGSIERTYNDQNQILTTVVMTDRPGQQLPQHYRMRFEYE